MRIFRLHPVRFDRDAHFFEADRLTRVFESKNSQRFTAIACLTVWCALSPFLTKAQVVINERVVLELKEEESIAIADSTGPAFNAAIIRDESLQKGQTVCPTLDESTPPCPDSTLVLRLQCIGDCDPGWFFVVDMITHEYPDNSDTTFTWRFPLAQNTGLVQAFVQSDGFAYIPFKSHTWWGVVWWSVGLYDESSEFLVGADHVFESPSDFDDDGIADAWEDDNGGKSMLNQLATCASPSAECTELDIVWDEEPSVGYPGDRLSKFREYQGVFVGGMHQRLRPDSQEVFIDYDDNPHGSWAVNEVVSQLGMKVISVDGLKDHDGSILVPGTSHLQWPGGLPPGENLHFILVDSVLFGKVDSSDVDDAVLTTPERIEHRYHGVAVVNGTYKWNPVSVTSTQCIQSPGCQPLGSTGNQNYGITGPDNIDTVRYWISTTYLGAIANVWGSNNSIPQDLGGVNPRHVFQFAVTLPTRFGPVFLTDFSPTGAASGPVNPFLGLAPQAASLNDSFNNGKVMSLTQDEFARRNTLHELGHALGIQGHPIKGASVMRAGIGPAKTASFEPDDLAIIKIR